MKFKRTRVVTEKILLREADWRQACGIPAEAVVKPYNGTQELRDLIITIETITNDEGEM